MYIQSIKDQITARASADQSLPLVICRTLDISSPIGSGKGEQGVSLTSRGKNPPSREYRTSITAPHALLG
jgi:hypothetical protein